MIIENISNLDESIKMFMYVHHRESWENGYEESRCVGMICIATRETHQEALTTT